MSRYIQLDANNRVLNMIVVEDKEQAEQDLQCILMELTNQQNVKVGNVYKNGQFYSPEELNALGGE